MTMPKRRTPNYKKAAAAIQELGEKPKEKKASPLEIFVSANYDRVIKAIENGYSLSEICVTLRQQNISALPKQLRSALYEQALKQGSVDQLPASLKPQLPEQPALRAKTEAI
ncbi:MAG: hypothetical protein F6K28_14095 [Microcoleus sp. SIO2G3]|nr:hypothetical protein [Microcoleus sp. SIO2G3]